MLGVFAKVSEIVLFVMYFSTIWELDDFHFIGTLFEYDTLLKYFLKERGNYLKFNYTFAV